jgi:hypothetical protein
MLSNLLWCEFEPADLKHLRICNDKSRRAKHPVPLAVFDVLLVRPPPQVGLVVRARAIAMQHLHPVRLRAAERGADQHMDEAILAAAIVSGEADPRVAALVRLSTQHAPGGGVGGLD